MLHTFHEQNGYSNRHKLGKDLAESRIVFFCTQILLIKIALLNRAFSLETREFLWNYEEKNTRRMCAKWRSQCSRAAQISILQLPELRSSGWIYMYVCVWWKDGWDAMRNALRSIWNENLDLEIWQAFGETIQNFQIFLLQSEKLEQTGVFEKISMKATRETNRAILISKQR